MPRRPHLTLLLLAALAPLAACGAPAAPPQAERAACSGLIDALPATVGGVVVQKKTYDASWGSFRLRCGVGRPKDFTATSQCLSVAGVDWYAPPDWQDHPSADVDLTTVSLAPRTQLHVAGKERGGPAAAALVELAPLLKSHLKTAKHCQ